jgi:hypothetical protein
MAIKVYQIMFYIHWKVICNRRTRNKDSIKNKNNWQAYVFAACLPFPNAAPKYFWSSLKVNKHCISNSQGF